MRSFMDYIENFRVLTPAALFWMRGPLAHAGGSFEEWFVAAWWGAY